MSITFVYFQYTQGDTTTNSVVRATQNLGEVIMDSASSPVDQTPTNLDTTAVILDSVANYVQTQNGSDAARGIVRCLFTTQYCFIIRLAHALYAQIVRESVRTVNYLLQWTPTAVDSERSSRCVL